MALKYFKDPDAELDFLFDWSDWLAVGESISTHTITLSGTGLTLESSSENSGIVTAWLSAGTVGTVYSVTCEIITDSTPPRKDDRTMKIRIQER